MNYVLFYTAIFIYILANFSARYLNPVDNPKFIKNQYLKALLIIPTKKKISTKGFSFYISQLILLIIVSLCYACGFMIIDAVRYIVDGIFCLTTFIMCIVTGTGDKMNY